MPVSRANLVSGPAKITWNGLTLYTREDVDVTFDQVWDEVVTSCYGVVDASERDRMIKIPLTFWGEYENAGGTGAISKLFPSSLLNPGVGSRLYGTTDLPMVLHRRGSGSTDRLTVHNVNITKLADLYLGVDNTFWGVAEFTGLIVNNGNPEDSAAYFTLDTAAYSDSGFALTNYNRQRWSITWNDDAGVPAAITGFSSVQAHKGVNLSWEMDGEFDYNANVGTVDYVIRGARGTIRANSILGPTLANINSARRFQGAGNQLGRRVAESRGNLIITGTTPAATITMTKAGLVESGMKFGAVPLIGGDLTWRSFRGFSSGTPSALFTIA